MKYYGLWWTSNVDFIEYWVYIFIYIVDSFYKRGWIFIFHVSLDVIDILKMMWLYEFWTNLYTRGFRKYSTQSNLSSTFSWNNTSFMTKFSVPFWQLLALSSPNTLFSTWWWCSSLMWWWWQWHCTCPWPYKSLEKYMSFYILLSCWTIVFFFFLFSFITHQIK